MARRTRRRRSTPSFLISGSGVSRVVLAPVLAPVVPLVLATALALAITNMLPLPILAQPAGQATLKQRMLVRDLILLQGSADIANQALTDKTKALAETLPGLLSYAGAVGNVDLNQQRQLVSAVERAAGANPFDEQAQLKDELARIRVGLEADGAGKVVERAGRLMADGKMRYCPVYFRSTSIINPTEPWRTFTNLPINTAARGRERWPGTINILIDATGSYLIFATGLDGKLLEKEGKVLYASGHLN